MTVNPQIEEALHQIEADMVNQFRVAQALRTLVQKEREDLVQRNAAQLTDSAEKKESLLDELGRLEEHRRQHTIKAAELCGLKGEAASLNNLLATLNDPMVERINHLREGFMAIQAELREINQGNYALAVLNLERLNSLQVFLVDLVSPKVNYQPNGSNSANEPPVSYGLDHQA